MNEKIWARKCQVRKIGSKIARDFFNENHLQGFTPATVTYGLYHNSELLMCISFGKPRFTKKIEWELLRAASSLNTSVIGGASRLFKRFVEEYDPKSIVSYSDRRWNTGHMYLNLGFKFVNSSAPNFWIFKNGIDLDHRVKFQKHNLPKLLENFDPKLTAWENMINHGYNRIWDCGNDVFVLYRR
jgi:hypothetical protein